MNGGRSLAAATLLLLAAAAPVLSLFPDRPPPAHTGGFGEPTCAACHFDVPEPDPRGGLSVEGLPEGGYDPGARYLLRVVLRRPEMRAGGFQLSARDAAGSPAGTLRPVDGAAELTEEAGVPYAHHTRRGTHAADSAAWLVEWTAPDGGGAIHLHAAGNAADGDGSPLGDHIYTHARVLSAP